jgi:membrane fusion protein, multidrug efflux system
MSESTLKDETTPRTAEQERSARGYRMAPSEPESHWGRWLFAAVVVLILAGGAFYYYQKRAAAEAAKAKAAAQPRGVPISASTAKAGDIGVYVEALGTVTPVYTVTVTSRVQGEITQIYYREGQMVKKGDKLIDIDSRPYEAALTQAEGQLAHDQAVLREAQIDLERYQAAYNRNAIAQQQVVDQEQLVKQSEGTVKNDEGAVANARVNLIYCHITSPIDGRVGLRLVDLGNIVQANSTTALVVITQLQPITVIFNVAEDYLDEIQNQLRQHRSMTVDAFNRSNEQKITSGKLLTIDNQVDTTTGTVKLRAIFENKDNILFPNQFVNARLLVTTEHNAVLIPTAAVQRNAQGAFVYVVKPDSSAAMTSVKPGTVDGNTQAVQGLQAGQVVAVSGFDKLQDGIKVTVRTGKSAEANAGSNANGDSAP